MAFLELNGIKKVDFFGATGIEYSNFKGKNIFSQPGGDMLVKVLTAYPKLSAEWLMRGIGPMTKDDISKNGAEPISSPIPKDLHVIISDFLDQINLRDETIRNQAESVGELKERVRTMEKEKRGYALVAEGSGHVDVV